MDSSNLEVCHLRSEKQHKVFRAFAGKGKGSTAWFYGLKVHLGINHLGELVCFLITPANTADNHHRVLSGMLQGVKGKCAGDKGYLTTLFVQFYTEALQLLVKAKGNMKTLLAFPEDVQLLRQRPLIESVNDIVATVGNVEHSRHRNALPGIANVLSALIAYQYLPHKAHIYIPGTIN